MNNSDSPSTVTRAAVRFATAFVAGLLISTGAVAQNLGTAFSDLWWNPAESGWGVTIDHQQDVMFLTFFLYRADNSPYWVTAVLTRTGTNSLSEPPVVFTGDVTETRGPTFGATFVASQVTSRKVGSATFSGSPLAATLQYSIDGVNVTKSLVRQTLRNVSFNGQELGAIAWTSHDCASPADNNVTTVDSATLTVAHAGAQFQLTAQGRNRSCEFRGTYSQQGAVGQVDAGTYSCNDGNSGTFSMNTLKWTDYGMAAGLAMKNASCSFRGHFGGITKAVATMPASWATLSFVISPEVYQVVSESNTTLTILGVWKPGQRDQLHSHLAQATTYWLTDCSLRIYAADGTSSVSNQPAGHAGTTSPGSHVAENIGTSDCRMLFFEPK